MSSRPCRTRGDGREEPGRDPGQAGAAAQDHPRQPARCICRARKWLPDVADRRCACCGGLKLCIGEDVSQRLDRAPAQFKVIVTRRPKYACRTCQGEVAQAPAARAADRERPADRGAVAHVLVAKYRCPATDIKSGAAVRYQYVSETLACPTGRQGHHGVVDVGAVLGHSRTRRQMKVWRRSWNAWSGMAAASRQPNCLRSRPKTQWTVRLCGAVPLAETRKGPFCNAST